MRCGHPIAQRTRAAPPLPMLALALALGSWTSLAAAQRNLGELLDTGATRLTPQEFQQEIVQRVLVGPTASGGSIEIMYVPNGMIQGVGKNQVSDALQFAPITGNWTMDNSGTVCTTMRIGGGAGSSVHGVALPARCQFWYRQGSQFYFSDSDTDRGARVFRRTLKP